MLFLFDIVCFIMSSSPILSITLLEDVKNQKILRPLKGEVGPEEPKEQFHNYIEELTAEKKKNMVSNMEKDGDELAKLNISQISLSTTLYQKKESCFQHLRAQLGSQICLQE